MQTTDLVKLAAEGNISEFHAAVEDTVIGMLRTKIENYRNELGASLSITPDDDE